MDRAVAASEVLRHHHRGGAGGRLETEVVVVR
jgi:hypothetical protein